MSMKKIEITQVKSKIGRNKNQRDTLNSLGLKKIGQMVVREKDDVTLGMIRNISHLIKINEVN